MPSLTPETRIDDLELSIRTGTILQRLGVTTVAELLKVTDRAFLTSPGLGSRKCLREVDALLAEGGLSRPEGLTDLGPGATATAGEAPVGGEPAPSVEATDPRHPRTCTECGHDGMPLFLARAALQQGVDQIRTALDDGRASTRTLASLATKICYALGAMEEDVCARAQAAARRRQKSEDGRDKWSRAFDAFSGMFPGLLETYLSHERDLAGIRSGAGGGGAHGRAHAAAQPRYVTCEPTAAHGGRLAPGWACCACYRMEGLATYNGTQRAECKHCGHPRCDVVLRADPTDPPAHAAEPVPPSPSPTMMHPEWPAANDRIIARMLEEYATGGGGAQVAAVRSSQVVTLDLLRWIACLDWPTWKAWVMTALPIDTVYATDKRWWMFVRSFRLHCEGIVAEADGVAHGPTGTPAVADPPPSVEPAPWEVPPASDMPDGGVRNEPPAEVPPTAAPVNAPGEGA